MLTKPRVILDALGLPGSVVPSTARSGMVPVTSEVILEAEMVAFSDATERIDGKLCSGSPSRTKINYSSEFWRIRSLIESTAIGPRHKVREITKETAAM